MRKDTHTQVPNLPLPRQSQIVKCTKNLVGSLPIDEFIFLFGVKIVTNSKAYEGPGEELDQSRRDSSLNRPFKDTT